MRFIQPLLILLILGIAACQNDNTSDGSAVPAAEGPAEAKSAAETAESASATADFHNAEAALVGTATFTQAADGVLVRVEFNNLQAGPHALHIHDSGLCEPPEFTSAGDHFNPDGKEHGFNNPNGPHAGDLPNFTVAEDGKASLETLNPRVSLQQGAANSLLKPGGTSLVIHMGTDDYQTDPAGDSGERIACGVVQPNMIDRTE